MRIASLSPAVTEILFAIGADRQIVCTDHFSDYPDGAKKIPHLKDHQNVDPAALAEYLPDMVFTSTLVQQRLAEELRRSGDMAVIHQDPRSMSEIYESIMQIGLLTEKTTEAKQLIQSMQQGFAQVKKKASLLPRKLKVYCEEWHNPPMVSGNWVPDAVKIAGGIPFPIRSPGQELRSKNYEAGNENMPSREVTLGEIQAFDPDMIILSICGSGRYADKALLTDREGWAQLKAVKAGHLFVIDDSLLNRPGPRLIEGAQRIYSWLFQILH